MSGRYRGASTDEEMSTDEEKKRRKYRKSGGEGPSLAGIMSTLAVVLGIVILVLVAVHHSNHAKHAEETRIVEEPCDPTAPVLFWGNDLNNSNYRDCDPIDSSNIEDLGLHCYLNVGASVSAKPTIYDGVAYFPTWENLSNTTAGGKLWAVYVDTCQVKWSRYISYYTDIDGDVARVSPAIDPVAGRYVVLGSGQGVNAGGAFVFAADTSDGAFKWITQVHPHPLSIITTSMVIDNDLIWGGVASREEAAAAFIPNYNITFQGSAFLLSANTGAFLNEFNTALDNTTGNAIWGSTPIVDPTGQKACFTTGNNYNEDNVSEVCYDDDDYRGCLLAKGNLVNAFVCLDMTGFELEWAHSVTGLDAWNVACVIPGNPSNNCPEIPGPDYDFGQGPMLGAVRNSTHTRRALFAGQKSGIFWAIDYETGDIIWSNQVAPGSTLGGFEWGSALSPQGIFAANANRDYNDYEVSVSANYQGGVVPSGTITCSGSWVRLDTNTGRVLWQTIDPVGVIGSDDCDLLREEVFPAPDLKQVEAAPRLPGLPMQKGRRNAPGHAEGPLAYALGPVSVVNDVMFAGSMTGFLYGMDANNGKIKFSFDTGGSYNTAPAVWNGHVITGSGYERFGLGEPQEYLFVFKIGGDSAPPSYPA